MNAVATDGRLETTQARRATAAERLLAALPLASVYLWLSIVYIVEALKRVTPWLFTDELELTQLSRSIASTGHAARRGQPHSFDSLYTVLTAPIWLIKDVATAYAGVKYLDVLVMTSVVFPAYFLARLVVGRRWALFAAAGAGSVPALAYSSWIVEENLAYPYAALCFLLIAKALVHRSRGWIAAAAVATAVAPAVRGELVVVPAVLGLALLFAGWSSRRARERRAGWSRGDWVGFVTILAGAVIGITGLIGHHYQEWLYVTTYYKHRAFVMGDWAAGALAIGLGVIPLVVGLAALVPARGEARSRELRMVRCVAVAGLIGFGVYTAIKAAYISTVFATRVEERNLIYIAPLLFAGTALVLERRRVNPFALAGAAAYGLYIVCGTPFHFETQLYSDALGLAVLEQANRYFMWTSTTAQWIVIAVLAGGVALLAAALALRRVPRAAAGVAAALALSVLAWNLTAEIAAAAGTVSVSRDIVPTLTRPFTWVDDHTHGRPTLYLAQGVGDQNPEWLLEFWNRSIVGVSSIDGTLGGPGPAGAPNVTAAGKLFWTHDPAHPGRQYAYAVEDWPCIAFAGKVVATHGYRSGSTLGGIWRLVELTQPNRLSSECSGIYPDGWSGANDSSYFRFLGGRSGWLRVELSRGPWSSTPVTIEFGQIVMRNEVPALGTVTQTVRLDVPAHTTVVRWLRTPATAFAAKVVVADKLVPHQLDPSSGDVRTLGVQVSYRYFSERPRTRR